MEVFAYLGPEEYSKREKIQEILKKNKESWNSLQQYHAGSVDIEEIQSLLLVPPLFGDPPWVLINDIDLLNAKNQKKLSEIIVSLQKRRGANKLFLLSKEYKLAASLAKVVAKSDQKVFWGLSDEDKKKHILQFVHKHKFQIETNAVELLFERVSNDIIILEKNLETIFLYLSDREDREISEELLSRILVQGRDTSIFDIFHYLAQRNLAKAMLGIETLLLEGSGKIVSHFIVLQRHWDKLLLIKERMPFHSFDEICNTEFIKTKALKADYHLGVQKYKLEELKFIQKINQEYSLRLKLGSGIQDELFRHYIFRCISAR